MYPFCTSTVRRLFCYAIATGIFVLILGCNAHPTNDSGTAANVQTAAVEPPSPTLQIQMSGARSDSGNFACALFANSDDFANRVNPVASASLPVAQSTWTVSDLPAGRYAAAIFHDENLDTKLNRHALGYPLEAYGFSKNARGRFGPPRYEDAAFEFQGEVLKIKIDLK